MGYRDYSTAKGHIVDATGKGDFTTIASALTAASSGQTIFIRPGTYTENPTLKAGVNLSAFECDGITPNVTIVGNCTFSGTGVVTCSGIQFKTNSAAAITVSGSSASVLELLSCYINANNATAIALSSSNAGSTIVMQECQGNINTTGIALFAHSGAGTLIIQGGIFANSGNSTTANTVSGSGSLQLQYCANFQSAITTSSTSTISVNNTRINTSAINTIALTHGGTGVGSTCYHAGLESGTASALSVGSGATLQVDFLEAGSSNTNAITGAGTIKYGVIVYTSTSSTNNASTQTALTTQPALSSFAVQQVRVNKTAAQTVTSTIAAITTQPTTANGTSVISLSITPTNSSHVLVLEGNITFTSGGNFVSAYFIQNATGNGFGVAWQTGGAANQPLTIPLRYYMTAGTTSAIQFDLYITVQAGGNVFVNANTSATQLSGGAAFTSLIVTEYTS